jgi:hypothetical protein
MSKFARGVLRGSVWAVAFLLPVVSVLAAGQAPAAPASGARGRTARAADSVLSAGLQAKIPPHVSDMLGISSDQKECLVSQRFERTGSVVRGFNVSVTNVDDVVLFVTDEAANDQTYYLTSRQGRLRRMVVVRGGTGNVLPLTGKEKAAFQKELQFWLDRIVPRPASK